MQYVVLVFDKVKVKENPVFDKHSLELVGFKDLGDISNLFEQAENQTRTANRETSERVATYMLTFFVRRSFPILSFPILTSRLKELHQTSCFLLFARL